MGSFALRKFEHRIERSFGRTSYGIISKWRQQIGIWTPKIESLQMYAILYFIERTLIRFLKFALPRLFDGPSNLIEKLVVNGTNFFVGRNGD